MTKKTLATTLSRMLTIRLQRVGKKHQPSYRVVVSERRSKLGGPPIEDLGFYNPFTKEARLNKDRIEHWIKIGAHATPTVHNLCVTKGVVKTPKIALKFKKRKSDAEVAKTEALKKAETLVEAKKEETAVPATPAA